LTHFFFFAISPHIDVFKERKMKIISSEQVEAACRQMARNIKERTPDKYTLVAVSRGGLMPAAMVAHYLDCKNILFIRLSSYDNDKERSKIVDTTADKIPDKPDTYIIDDICDSGETLKYLRKKYPHAQIYTLVNKNQQIQPDFAPITEPRNLWINFPWEFEDREAI
jgi:xanthine phosphoribosyltransferase